MTGRERDPTNHGGVRGPTGPERDARAGPGARGESAGVGPQRGVAAFISERAPCDPCPRCPLWTSSERSRERARRSRNRSRSNSEAVGTTFVEEEQRGSGGMMPLLALVVGDAASSVGRRCKRWCVAIPRLCGRDWNSSRLTGSNAYTTGGRGSPRAISGAGITRVVPAPSVRSVSKPFAISTRFVERGIARARVCNP
jgi:hypothetical protein